MLQFILLCSLWLLLGVVIGLLARVAGVVNWPVQREQRGRDAAAPTEILGALTAFAGGWLGVWLVGRPFATAMALWIAIVCVLFAPRLRRVS